MDKFHLKEDMIRRMLKIDDPAAAGEFHKKLSSSCGNEIDCITVRDFASLTRVIGDVMYINRGKYDIYLRGQSRSYLQKDKSGTVLSDVTLIPSLYRNDCDIKRRTDAFNCRINEFLKKKPLFNAVSEKQQLEPLLQHYGIRTNQLDVVDNVWVALWFATHDAKSVAVRATEYIHFYETEEEYCYIYLIATDASERDTLHSGIYTGKETILTDLRKAVPSYFVRPHAQHAFMIKKTGTDLADYTDLVFAIIRIPTSAALEWIGNGAAASCVSLFPPVVNDPGYEELLKQYPVNSDDVHNYGSIQIITG